jgi:hypothetical protein
VTIMTVLYWLAAGFAFAAYYSARHRAAAPAVLFTLLALGCAVVTPIGQDILNAIVTTGSKVAEGGAK